MFGILTSLIPLIVVGGLVYAIVRAVRGRTREPLRPGDGGSVTRLFAYAMLYVALIVSGIGSHGLLGRILANADVRSDTELATTLALTLVGIPVFVTLGRWTWNRLVSTSAERDALGWSLYIAAALITSLATAAGALIGIIARIIDESGYGGYDGRLVAMVVVWGGIWIGHWFAWRAMPPARATSLQLLLGSALGLGLVAAGVGTALTHLGWLGFDNAADVVTTRVDGDDVFIGLVAAAVGVAVWSWHWLVHGVKLERSPMWLAYVLLYGVLGGLAATVIGGGRAVFLILEWLFGDPETTSALTHFRHLSPALAGAFVGLGVWRYHGALVGPRAGRPRTDVDRVYDSIVAATALSTIAVALTILVLALFRLAAPAAAASGDTGGDVLLGAITLLLIGGPLWTLTWGRMQKHAGADGDEAASTPRRVYLFSILGVSGVVAFGALIGLLIVVFATWLGERSGSLNEALQWPVALLVTTGTTAGYHFVVARAERHLREESPRRDVLLVWSGNGEAADIAALTHATIRVLQRTDEAPTSVDPEAVARAIDAAQGPRLIVVAGGDGIIAVPYE